MTFNRTRQYGPVDTRVSVLRVDVVDGSPIAVAVNFHSRCIACMESDPRAVNRDWPGDVWLVANSSELLMSLRLGLGKAWLPDGLLILGYFHGCIGYARYLRRRS